MIIAVIDSMNKEEGPAVLEETKEPDICQACGKTKICFVDIGTTEHDSCSPVCRECLENDPTAIITILKEA